MSILENTAVLEIGNMDSGILFDHDNDEKSMRSVTTAAFDRRNTPVGAVSGLQEATTTLEGTQTNETDATAASSRGAAGTASDSTGGTSQEIPPPAQADVVGAVK